MNSLNIHSSKIALRARLMELKKEVEKQDKKFHPFQWFILSLLTGSAIALIGVWGFGELIIN